MTDQTESASDYAELLRSLDNAKRIYGDGLSGKAAAAIRALEAKVHRLEVVKAGLWDVSRNDFATMSELRADRDRLAGEVERIRTQFDEAIARIKDMLEGDDGQAFKEAGKFLLRIKGRDHES